MSSCKAICQCGTVWSVDGSFMCVEGLETRWVHCESLLAPGMSYSWCNSAFGVWVACVQPSVLFGLPDF